MCIDIQYCSNVHQPFKARLDFSFFSPSLSPLALVLRLVCVCVSVCVCVCVRGPIFYAENAPRPNNVHSFSYLMLQAGHTMNKARDENETEELVEWLNSEKSTITRFLVYTCFRKPICRM